LYVCEAFLTLKEEHKLEVPKNKLLRKIYEPKRDEIRGQFKYCIMTNFVVCTGHWMLSQ